MDKNKSNLWVGGILIAVGLLYLLNNLDMIFVGEDVAVSIVFFSVGAFMFFKFSQSRSTGFLITAVLFTFIGLVIWLESIPGIDDQYIAVIFLWFASGLFSYGFFRNTENWGFLIPAGILFTIGSMVWLDLVLYDDDVLGSVFFLGVGLTFGFLYLVRNEKNKLDWAKIPAICLIAFAGFLFFVTSDSIVTDLFLPVTLILVGGYLVYHSTKQKSVGKQAKNSS